MNIYITAVVAICFFVLATVVIVTTTQQEEELRFLGDEEIDKLQLHSFYREIFILGIGMALGAAVFALVGYSLFTY